MTKIVQLVNTCRECPNRHYYSAGTYECEKVQPSRLNADMSIPGWCPLPNYPDGPDMSPEFTDTARDALLWVLWHHQGGSSKVGQPIRFALGKAAHEPLSDHEVERAKRWAAADFKTFEAPGNAGVMASGGPCEVCGRGEVINGKCDRCGADAPVPPPPPLVALKQAEERIAGVPATDAKGVPPSTTDGAPK